MDRRVIWLRVAYWWGIVADAVMAVQMLWPRLFVRFMNVDLAPNTGLSYGLRNGAPLMIGWTLLLFWADRKPVARKEILLLTIPVVVGYVLIEIHSLVTGLTSLAATVPLFVMQAGMIALFIYSYLRVQTAESGPA